MAIFEVNRVGAITRRTSPGFRSNLVQRDCIGGATCMPIHFLFSLKNGDGGGAYLLFDRYNNTVLAYISRRWCNIGQ